MKVHVILLYDADRAVTDVVGLSNKERADGVARDLERQFGRERVSQTILMVDELPLFWGLNLNGKTETTIEK